MGRAVPTSLFPACASASPRCQPPVKTKAVIAALPAPLCGKGWKMALPDAHRRVGVRGELLGSADAGAGVCRGSRAAAPAASPCALTPACPELNPGGKSSPLSVPSPAGELGSPAARVNNKTQRRTTAFAWFSENPQRGYVTARCKFIERCIWRLKHQQRFNFFKRLLLVR